MCGLLTDLLSAPTLCARVVIGDMCSDRFHDSRTNVVSKSVRREGFSNATAAAATGTQHRHLGLADARALPRGRLVGVLPPDGERGRARSQRELRAKEMCRQLPCDRPVPLTRPCRRRALRHLGRAVRIGARVASQARHPPRLLPRQANPEHSKCRGLLRLFSSGQRVLGEARGANSANPKSAPPNLPRTPFAECDAGRERGTDRECTQH